MKRELSTHNWAADGEVPHLASAGNLNTLKGTTPCSGPSARDARHAPSMERLGSLLHDWLETIGYRKIFPGSGPEPEMNLPFTGQQLREIGKRIDHYKKRSAQARKASSSSRPPEPLYLDNADLMRILNISPRTSRLWREKGWLNFSRVGQKVFFRIEDVEGMLEKGRGGGMKFENVETGI